MSALDDGSYDVIVVDVEEIDDKSIRVELVITAGPRKGEVTSVRGAIRVTNALSLLGEPGVLTVANGQPSLALG